MLSPSSRNNSQVKTVKRESFSNLSGLKYASLSPTKKSTDKYLNQLNHLDLLEAEMEEVDVQEEAFSKGPYVKKTVTNLKKNRTSKNNLKTSASVQQGD